jgi:hypothetical protein
LPQYLPISVGSPSIFILTIRESSSSQLKENTNDWKVTLVMHLEFLMLESCSQQRLKPIRESVDTPRADLGTVNTGLFPLFADFGVVNTSFWPVGGPVPPPPHFQPSPSHTIYSTSQYYFCSPLFLNPGSALDLVCNST